MRRIITINSNQVNKSVETKKILTEKLTNAGFEVTYEFCQDAELIISIGGDGSFLRMIKENNFNSDIYYIGINAGTLGFAQEVSIDNIDEWFKMGVSCVGVGSSLLGAGSLEDIENLAKEFKNKIAKIRG